jgi:pyruvate,water dikinase
MTAQGLPVPAWFVLSSDAFDQSLTDAQQAKIQRGTIDEIGDILTDLSPAPTVIAEVSEALRKLPSDRLYAVRSSAADEDSGERSFAGQLDSFLSVPSAAIPARIADVWRSGFSERVVAYRREQCMTPVPRMAPAVIVQSMISPEAAGVAFSADPVSGRRGVTVISAVFGLATALVSGESDADVYEVDRSGKVLPISVADNHHQRVLSDQHASSIATLARRVERCFGCPQDIEWAMEGGVVYLLQARPITTLRHLADPDGQLYIWDNNNISESYGGITTPLTFSFARGAYEAVYREFCHMLAVSKSAIASNAPTFHNMLGLIRGRVYYNAMNWYRVLALLPGFKDNRLFFEQMLGVKQVAADDAAPSAPGSSFGGRLCCACSFAHMAAAIVWNYLMLPRRMERFYARLNDSLEPAPAFDDMRTDELAHYYSKLASELVVHWDAPVLNDLFLMMFHGWLRRLCKGWLYGRDELANELMRSLGTMISIEPAAELSALAAEIANHHSPLIQVLLGSEPLAAISALRDVPELRDKYDQYLERFGDRCIEELKLESSTLHDNPALLLRRLGELAQAKTVAQETGPVGRDSHPAAMRNADRILRRRPLRRLIFHWVVSNSRRCVCQRENLRFQRTRVFGRVRRIFVEIGRRFQQSDALEDSRDIFYLQVEEILAFVNGTAVTTKLKDLVCLRKREWDEFRREPVPSDRFETRGPVYQGNSFRPLVPTQEVTADPEERIGLGCSPGKIRGQVRLVTSPRDTSLVAGNILVAERTDPGWILLFPMAAGLIVERGNLLSHSAIVSRELGIPCVASLAGATKWLHDGDLVELDGGNGIVRRLAAQEAHVA